ncbi:MAG: thiosulfate oxidation carrier protein SoxY [Methylococcaceae bacterium]|nr:thiosulfate oxidation carrier protein SoxY [Methylococcaceae bacterium]
MKFNRRHFLKTTLILSTTGLGSLETRLASAEWSAVRFAESGFDQTLKQISNGKPIVESDKINLDIPEIAENGALVPFTVTSTLDDPIKTISIIVEQNPVPLIIQTQLMPELEIFMSARLKIANSSFVFAIAEGEKVCYSVKKKVKVTIGGCGG